jgi:YbgC/YbaW family acyl-CoA thioester hydrolase
MLNSSGDKIPHVFDVFIEDTDCFGVVYNANYLKFFDRARQAALGIEHLAARQQKGDVMRLVDNKEIKISGSAVLGQELEVLSSFAPSEEDKALTAWQQTIACKKTGTVLASSQASTFLGPAYSSQALESRLVPDAPVYKCEYTVWADEIDARAQLSDVSILKVWRRARPRLPGLRGPG